jgi:hypothetical protein
VSASSRTDFRGSTALWCSLSARLLGWRPGDFWNATPTELLSALRDPETIAATQPPSRELIARMMERDTYG